MNTAANQKHFTSTLIQLMIPITIQQFFNAGLALVDNMFIGQLGEKSVASVSLAYQIYFILSIIYFGINSGSAIFTAQFWGKQDIQSIRKVVGINVILNTLVGIIFTCLAEIFPEQLLSIYTNDPQVIMMGAQYLRVYAIGFIVVGLSQGLYGILRSTERVRIPMFVNSLALIVNTSLGYVLIFGKLGLPGMGVLGAATANATARVLETIVLIVILIATKSILLRDIHLVFPIPMDFFYKFLRTCAPVVLNEIFWSVGTSSFSAIYAHISTEAVAATNIATSIENLAVVPFLALGYASAVMIGNKIGADDEDSVRSYTRKILSIAVITGLVMGLLMFLVKDFLLDIYNISANTTRYSVLIITALSLFLFIKACNLALIIGIIRAGGDTRFALFVEMGSMWLYGVPAAWIGANIFHLPVYWVVVIVLSEEILKGTMMFLRYRSWKWIHYLAKPAN